MGNGRVIFLNGTSSAGKSSIVKVLHKVLNEPAYKGFKWILPVSSEVKARIKSRVNVDPPSVLQTILLYNEAIEELGLVDEIARQGMKIETGAVFKKLASGMHQTLAAFASQGNNIIFDHVLWEKEWLPECLQLLEGVEVLFLGIRCPIEVVEQRERDRGNRFLGQARASVSSPEDCAMKIVDRLKNGPPSDAFDRLRKVN